MGARELGRLCEAARRERGWSLARMAYEIGLVPPDDRVLNESQAKRILEGQRGLDEWMVQRLIDIFDLDPAEAWVAAGLLPPDVDAAMLRRLGIFAARPVHVLREYLEPAGHDADVVALRPIPGPGDLDEFRELIRPDRRRHDRRKPAYRPVAPELLRAS